MKILIADDNYASRKLLKAYLEPHGECTFAHDGGETLQLVTAALDAGEPFDLLCLDIMMPELDGSEALKRIRALEMERNIEKEKRLKVIMVTALDGRKDIIRLFNDGCEGYLIKPIDAGKLNRVLVQLGLIADS